MLCIITSEQEQTLSAKPDAKRAANEYVQCPQITIQVHSHVTKEDFLGKGY